MGLIWLFIRIFERMQCIFVEEGDLVNEAWVKLQDQVKVGYSFENEAVEERK